MGLIVALITIDFVIKPLTLVTKLTKQQVSTLQQYLQLLQTQLLVVIDFYYLIIIGFIHTHFVLFVVLALVTPIVLVIIVFDDFH